MKLDNLTCPGVRLADGTRLHTDDRGAVREVVVGQGPGVEPLVLRVCTACADHVAAQRVQRYSIGARLAS